jgi:hypothetical protein
VRTSSESTSVSDVLRAYTTLSPNADTRDLIVLSQQVSSLLRAGWVPTDIAAMVGAFVASGVDNPGNFSRWCEQRKRRINTWWLTD